MISFGSNLGTSIEGGFWVSNKHLRANLASVSTRQKISILACTRISQNDLFQKSLGLARLANIRQAVYHGLARLELAKIFT
jgi:hypothetical protein